MIKHYFPLFLRGWVILRMKRREKSRVWGAGERSRSIPESYEEHASFISKVLFLWMNPLLSLGNKRPLNPSDLPQLSYE